MADERVEAVDKAIAKHCEVCEHGGLKRRCDTCFAATLEAECTTKDATIAELRAEVERLKADLLTATMSATEHQAKYVTMHGRHQELWRENL